MHLPLSLSILLHYRALVVSTAGVMLAVLLIFSQAGFWNALFDNQTEIIRLLNGDLMIINKQTRFLYASEPFSRRRLQQALACQGVKEAVPLYFESFQSLWKNPRDGGTRQLRVLACDPADDVLLLPD